MSRSVVKAERSRSQNESASPAVASRWGTRFYATGKSPSRVMSRSRAIRVRYLGGNGRQIDHRASLA